MSIIEVNDQNLSNMNVSIHSTSNKPFQKSNISSLKRNGSPVSSKVKKHITSVDVAASHVSFTEVFNFQMLYFFFVRNKKH